MHQGDLQLRGGLVQELTRGRIIGGIYEHLAAGSEAGDIVGRNGLHQGFHQGEGVEFLETAFSRRGLGFTQILFPEEHLVTQVSQANPGVIHQSDGAYPGGQKKKGGGGPQAAGAGNEDPGCFDLFLGLPAPPLQVHLAGVPGNFCRAQIGDGRFPPGFGWEN
jgi:hypothetical protein